MQDTLAKKIFAVGSAVAMTLTAAVPFVAHGAAHGAGSNVLSSDGTVWFITSSGTRRAYTSAGAFQSFGFNSFANVVPANSEDLALAVDAAGFIPPQDGKIFCATESKGSDVKGECSLITGGQKAAFTSAAVFTGLGFSFARAQYGDSSFLMKTSNIDNTTAAHRTGVLVNNGGTVQLVGANGLLGIPDLATFNSWGYSFADVVPANTADKALVQTGVMVSRQPGQLSPSWTPGTVTPPGQPPVVSGSVSAMLASDTPAAGTLVSESTSTDGSQTGADVAHFTFTGTGTVTQVVIKRIGVSADASINNVYLYMGNNRITDAGTFSNGQVTFGNSGGLFTVNGSTTVSVRVDVANSISGQTMGAQLASFTVANGTPMSTSISGNIFTIAQVSDLATVKLTVSSGNSSITSSGAAAGNAGTINAGTMNATLWTTPITVSQRAVKLQYVQFKQIGSVAQDAIQNLKLMVDGVQIGSTASVTNSGANTNVVIFDLTANPFNMTTGSHVLQLNGDVVKGTSYNYNFTLQTATDALFWDTSYGVNVPLTYSGGTTILQLSPGTTTINSGTVTVQTDPAYNMTQHVKNASQVELGRWTIKAYGEDVKVQTLQVKLTYNTTPSSTEGFNNLTVYVNGSAVGSSQSALNPGATNKTYTFGTTNLFTVPAGQSVTVSVKGDSALDTSTSVTSVRADLITPQNSLQGVTSFTLSPSSGASTYTGTTLTVTTSAATTNKNTNYTNQTISPNLSKQKIGSFIIQASNADGVRVNNLTVDFTTAGTGNSISPTSTLSGLYLVTPDFPNGTTPMAVSASNSFTVNFTVDMNKTATVDVYADITNASGTITPSLSGTGLGVSSNQTVYLNASAASGGAAVQGQTITVGAGTLNTPTLKTSSSPTDMFVAAGGVNQAAAVFNFVASSGGLVITQLDFRVATGTSGAPIPVTKVTVGSTSGNIVGATSTITGLSISVPTTYSGVDVPVTMDLAQVGANALAGNIVFTVNLTHVKYTSGGTTTDAYYNLASNSFILVSSSPTVTLASMPAGTLLTAGTQTVAKLTVAATGSGDITLQSIPFSFSGAGGASTTVAGNNIILVEESTGQTASTSNTSFGVTPGGSAATTTLYISTRNTISPGSPKTYLVQVPITGTFSASPAATFATAMGSATGFTYLDVNSNASGVALRQTNTINGASLTATYVPNYPTTQASLHN